MDLHKHRGEAQRRGTRAVACHCVRQLLEGWRDRAAVGHLGLAFNHPLMLCGESNRAVLKMGLGIFPRNVWCMLNKGYCVLPSTNRAVVLLYVWVPRRSVSLTALCPSCLLRMPLASLWCH